ncbi:erythroblast NAD(P)(+)--arginine ADP-ribosyltransferase-like isoform X2 [Epinephelus fuscoguttatus]|uniref:erythroblast NAD(P)(+)--arginine ADP-ribosyltransferase-like isoform X2 n=1 Tax=Epinephelus fuscoguttatus TaxID=293821 RepID=UPI0020D0BDD6|nr:erythroblast NAD(P)(+)--arginine ADP-ribosyltransferase-like isoform X2 [Epinephelus fuscoguttatus]
MAAVTFWAAVLLTYGVSTGIAMVPSGSSQGQGRYAKASRGSSKVPSRYQKASRASSPVASGSSNIPSASWQAPSGAGSSAGANTILRLDMAPNSVDDMYQGCKDKMYQNLQELLANEKNKNPTFKGVWESSEQWYDNKSKKSKPALGKDRLMAIYCYTFGGDNKVYLDFNTAVRTQKDQYTTTFRYHALHFLLTDAIQTLRERRLSNLAPGEDRCVTGYRRVDTTFDQVVNTQLRFGSFTSTSKDQYANKYFGDKTCFKIYTCFGADVSMYSPYPEEREVLIPPYEVFKVVGVKKRSQYKNLPCKVEYELRSTGIGTRRNLNCDLFKKKRKCKILNHFKPCIG